MSFLQLLDLLRRLPFSQLLNYPDDITDSKAVRAWVQAVVEAVSVFAEVTNTKLDDEILTAIKSVLDDDATWDAVHGLVVRLFGGGAVTIVETEAIGDPVEIDPVFIMLIIQVIRILLGLFKRKERLAA